MIEETVSQFLRGRNFRDAPLLVGVSGGADSVALLRALLALRGTWGLEISVAHFNHRWRERSGEDAGWVAALCEKWNVPCFQGQIETDEPTSAIGIAPSRLSGLRTEAAARTERYSFFSRTMNRLECSTIALAHTADDQAETVLHHLLRGSGLQGLSGIPATRAIGSAGTIVRPLLTASRRQVLDYLQSIGQEYLHDETNDSSVYTRNRLRREVLPHLREAVNPRVDEALQRLANQAQDAQEALAFIARELLEESRLECRPGHVRLTVAPLLDRPAALVREAFSQLWQQQGWPRQSLSFEHLSRLARLATGTGPDRISLPGGIEAESRGTLLHLWVDAGDVRDREHVSKGSEVSQ